MKSLVPLAAILVLLPAQVATAQSARAQLIHVSPDPALDTLDVYLDNALLVEDFVFRSATPYFDIAAGQHSVSFAPPGSQSSGDAFLNTDVDIEEGETYSLLAVGVGDPRGFAPNPDGIDTGFELIVASGARETSNASNRFHLRQIYFVPDMPTSDFLIGSFVDPDITYGAIRDFEEDADPGSWVSHMRSSGMATSAYVELSFNSDDLVGLGVLAVISGLYYTGNGIDIEAFFVRPDGTIKPFETTTETFRSQMIHASADPAVESVDVYLDGGLLFRDLNYPGARPFIDLPDGRHQLDVVPAGVAIADGVLLSHRESSSSGDSKQFFLTGFAESEKLGTNPDGLDTDLRFLVADDARETNSRPDRFYLRQIYTTPDMPTSDFLVGSWVGSSYKYGDWSDFEDVDPGSWTSFMRSSGKSTSPYLQMSYNSSDLVGLGILAVISGLYYTEVGIDMEAFFVRPDGSIKPFQTTTSTFRSQMIHASADPVAESIDVYLDGGLLFKDLRYTGARPFIDVPVGTHQIDVVPSGTSVEEDVLLSYRESSSSGDSKHFLLAGFVDPASWPSNPEGHETAIDFFVAEDAPEVSSDPTTYRFRQFYSVADIPAIDFWIDTINDKVFEDVGYCQFTPLRASASTEDLVRSVRASGAGRHEPALISVQKNWSDHIGTSFLEVITGVRDDIDWFYVTPDGVVESHIVVTNAEEVDLEIPSKFSVAGNHPNPFNPTTQIMFDLPQPATVRVEVFDATGRLVLRTKEATFAAGARNAIQLDAKGWGSGLYLYKVIAHNPNSSWIGSGRMMLVK